MPSGLSNVRTIYSTESAFAALRWDGTVAVWGRNSWGGSTTDDTATPETYTGLPAGLKDVVDISSADTAFAALKTDGTVAVWGYMDYGGGGTDTKWSRGLPAGLKDVTAIYSNAKAFTALK
jgi:alpha-tubulin suppressor-like RCC1 family protein